jgi:site-specific DNA-methyltransferase (adenine-specific)
VASTGPSAPKRRRNSTSTSAFGVGKREGHDASEFYARFAPPELSDDDVVSDDPTARAIDRVVHGSSTDMADVADGSVALVVTSPPYFAGKAYETELDAEHVPATYLEYLQMLRDVFAECVRTLEPGGRIAVNVANLGRRPYRSLAADVTAILQDDLRLLLRGEVVWVKQRGASGSCAWGSFQRATNPVLRDLTERVIIASKGRFDRAVPTAERARRGLPASSTIHRDEFMDATLDIWEMAPESATRVGHPAPFPVALPERLINLYTYQGDLVLDPFMGSGTTAVAALRCDRHFVGYDTDADYVARAEQRIQVERERLAAAPEPRPQVPSSAPPGEDALARAAREGSGAKELAHTLLEQAGFDPIDTAPKVAGLELSYGVRDVDGRRLLVDLHGSFTSARAGLRRPDVLWRALGRALTVSLADTDDPVEVVLLSTDVPTRNSAAGRSITAAVDPERGAVREVLCLDEDGLAVLTQLAKGLRPGDDGWVGSEWTSPHTVGTTGARGRSGPRKRTAPT